MYVVVLASNALVNTLMSFTLVIFCCHRYYRALSYPGLITLSPAVADPRQTGLLYSISKAIYIPRTEDGLATYHTIC